MTPPSRQDDRERQSASSCLLGLRGCASGCSCTVVVLSLSTWCVLPAPLLDRLPVEWVSGDLADSTHQLPRDTALLFSRNCRGSCVWICSPWRLVVLGLLVHATGQLGLLTLGMQTPLVAVMVALSFVSCWISGDDEICEVRRLAGLHCDLILCVCWHDGSKGLHLGNTSCNTLETILLPRRQTQSTPIHNFRSTRIHARLSTPLIRTTRKSTPFLASSEPPADDSKLCVSPAILGNRPADVRPDTLWNACPRQRRRWIPTVSRVTVNKLALS